MALLAVGNPLLGDDGAGVALGRALQARLGDSPDLRIFPAETAPENFGGPLRRFAPDLALWLDAADLGAPPGTAACLPWQAAEESRPGTHFGSPALFAQFMEAETGAEVLLLTVQPEAMGFGRPLSGTVAAAVEGLAEELAGLLRG